MPLFEYTCLKCKRRFELLVIGQNSKVACPHCGSIEIKKLVSSFSAQGIDSGSVCSGCSSTNCSSCGK